MALDFIQPSKRVLKGIVQVYPKFIVRKSEDLMIRGGDFYAIWNEHTGFWSRDEDDAIALIDNIVDIYAEDVKKVEDRPVMVLHLWDAESGMIDIWHKYCQRQRRDSYHPLDDKLIFDNDECKKTDYASRKLPYALGPCDIPAYEKIVSTLYSPEERHKIEWAIGSIVNGDSVNIQKFCVFYGDSGTGKSTIMNIIEAMFQGYCIAFDAKSLGSASSSFALEQFKSNPLVAIQQDGDLSRIEDNTRLNSLVSHEKMTVNEKFKSLYETSFKAFLFMGTNKPVKITDSKSGILRRLIDITPTGNLIPRREYDKLVKQVKFELGGIAWHCKEVYEEDPNFYDHYVPTSMFGASNDFYNFMLDNYFTFKEKDYVLLNDAWNMYVAYCDEAKVPFPLSKRLFKEELKAYFREFAERGSRPERARNVYTGFKTDKFNDESDEPNEPPRASQGPSWLQFKEGNSPLDEMLKNCYAQYGSRDEKPLRAWDNVDTKLCDIDTSKLHYVLPPSYHVVVDFDIKKDGKKCLDLNIEAASKFPPTYAELSKSGQGIHLHYNYTGDVSKLSAVYGDNIEIKVFSGHASLRRKLTKHNGMDIMTIASGLPLKEGKKTMINFKGVQDEKHLRAIIDKHLRKEIVPNTAPSMGLIFSTIEQMYESGKPYDISDLRPAIMAFAINSTHQPEECLKIYQKIHWTNEPEHDVDIPSPDDTPLVFFDIEVFPNLFLVCWKYAGNASKVYMFNPTPEEVKKLFDFKLVGYNCRRYDNHILYAKYLGYSVEELYALSQKIISDKKTGNSFFKQAYNISYTDVYDFCSTKQSLKKWEIQLGIMHKECPFPWDQPVAEENWPIVAEYCGNDVDATEATFNANKGDWEARLILAEWAGMVPNSTTNQLTTKIIFGDDKNTKAELQWRDMGDESQATSELYFRPDGSVDEYTVFDKEGRPIFPGYKFDMGKSTYRGEDPGEGGYVYAEPGIYIDAALLDIASMHPSSAIAEKLFGKYTKNFENIKQLRVFIKHKDFEGAKQLAPEKLHKYLNDPASAKALAQALKIAINSVYGLTSAKFENAFHDSRNKDNIVAKRGALFMINLKHFVQEHGYSVMHIKTDSIKIPNATLDIIQAVCEYGKLYGYIFEHEATYERICLVNDAVYIAKFATVEHCYELYGEEYVEGSKERCKENKEEPGKWTATGAQFAVPYVFKTLFSHEEIEFSDFCETKSVDKTALYLNYNEDGEDNYVFVGKIGQFTPVLPGTGGAELCRLAQTKTGETKYDSATGAKGYRWRQSIDVKEQNLEDTIDKSYYTRLVDEAKASIDAAGQKTGIDVEWFLN